ncbi:TPA: restriction endonuclease subunit S [Escherichia coli]|nr:restriction endonuclease subunit S [Escherichia coli]HEA3410581.1 restriction endonuclease subunit S [Escherichia coli]HEA3524751.1 restriction endonuclease subunit S [Escherichia coli]
MPKYEAYKDSQVQWIGDIPANWHLEKAKWLFYKADRKPLVDDDIVTCFRDGQVTLRKNRRTEGFTNALKEHGYQRICKGDLVIHAMDAFAGAIGVSDSDGKSTPVYAACVPRKIGKVNSYYYAYYMRDLALSGFIVSLAKGIRERSTDFRFNDFAELLLPFPDYEEQTLIANFLDKKTALIDEAISIKEKQISLLKERKQIIIQQAVTQGLDPNVPMKDSGVDWIGKIPAHWDIVPGFTVFKEGKDSNKGMIESQVLSLSYGNVIIKPEEKLVGLVPESFETYQIALPGDIIIRCTDLQNDKTSLRTGIVRNKGIITSAYLNLRLKTEHSAEFMHYFLHVLDITKTIYRFGSGLRQNLSYKDFKHMRILMPPKAEQIEIVNYINNQVEVTESSIDLIKNKIEKLKEYKTTLINSAVTGKIKITPEMVEQ